MKTITMYELLGMIKDGKAPKRIRFLNHYYIWKENDEDYQKEDGLMLFGNSKINYILNTEVEILEEEKKIKPLTKKDIEALGYACGEIQKCFTNGWTKSLENKPLEEEKKIPEKITDILRVDDLIPPVDENMYKIWTQTIKNQNKINEICDYLKSKEE